MIKPLLLSLLAGAVGAQDLDDNYTLGRLNGPGVNLQEALDQVRDVTGSAMLFDFRLGKAGSYMFDLPVEFLRASKNDASQNTYLLPGIRLAVHPADGWIADAQVTNNNLWVTTNGSDGATGFDNSVPRLLGTDFHLGFLSDGGRIPLSESTIPFAFLHGPIVSQGQFGLSGEWNQIHVDSSKMRAYDFKGAFGPASDVQVRAELKDTVYHGPYHVQSALLGGDWVSHSIRAGGWWSSALLREGATPAANLLTKSKNWGFHGYGGILIGERDLTAADVAGNWNGFFSNRLGAGQILIEDTASIYPGDKKAKFALDGSVGYGVIEPLTAGLRYAFSDSASNTDFQAWLTATASNIPLRKTGPGQASSIEYELGILPGAGQWAATTRWRLPVSNGHQTASYVQLEQDQLLPYSNPWQNWKLGWSRMPDKWTDFDVLATGGITESFFAMGRVSRIAYFQSDAGSSFEYDVKNAWVVDVGLGLHGPSWACLLDVPFSSGKGLPFESLERGTYHLKQGMDSRFGPIQLTLSSMF